MNKKRIGFALTGSFCTFAQVIPIMKALKEAGHEILPIMSEYSYATDTKFGTAQDFRRQVEDAAGRGIIHTIVAAEPIGPGGIVDVLVVAPCTGNTLAKLAHGITDTAVTMAVKSHLRGGKPVLLAVSSNDALGAAAKNIGHLLNYKNIYFVPMSQDDPAGKPRSAVADSQRIPESLWAALEGRQIQPLWL